MNAVSLITLALILFLAPLVADIQPTNVYRLGLLAFGSPTNSDLEAFWQGLRELGYVEGQNITMEFRLAEGKLDRLSALAAELVGLRVAVIVTDSTVAALAAKHATQTIPIVMVTVADPIGSGLVANLAHPGGNVTGMSLMASDLTGKRLELLKEAVPGLRRVAVLLNEANPGSALSLNDTESTARTLGLQLYPLKVRGPEDFEGAFAAVLREGANGLIELSDVMFFRHRAQIVDLAAKGQLPALYSLRAFASVGGLMAYGPSIPAQYRRVAYYVDRILKGAKPADLPVEQPTKFELVINLKTAQALGLTIPPTLLFQADEVIR
jgi:putative ABC transport system substrate-binding protein